MLILIGIGPLLAAEARQGGTHAEPYQGQILLCTQTEYYGDQIVRAADYWQFQSHDGNAAEIYVIEHILETSVCSQIIIDHSRSVVYHKEGDVVDYLDVDNFQESSPCLHALWNNSREGEQLNESSRITSEVIEIADDTQVAIDYPTYLLLAPAFTGEFPLLAQAPLMPHDRRGFFYEIPTAQLADERGIHISNTGIGPEELDAIVNYHIASLPGWELAPMSKKYPTNPYTLPGNKDVYFSLWNAQTDAVIEVEVHWIARQGLLRVLVATPPSPLENNSAGSSVIEGSSVAAADVTNLFEGWTGAENGPMMQFPEQGIDSYILRNLKNQNLYWFLDLQTTPDDYQVLYNRTVQQSACNPDQFLPDWATIP